MTGLTPLAQSVNSSLLRLADELNTNKLQLPSPPATLIQLRTLIKEQADINDISKLLNRDPHLSARIIKIANSALFTSRLPVSSVKTAVIRLGLQKVCNLVTGLAITQSFINNKTQGIEKTLKHSWDKSILVAAIASTLARTLTELDPEEVLLAGQVHNIGVPPLLFYINNLPELRDAPELKIKVIHLVLTKRAAAVGSAILKKWQFPAYMQQLPYLADSNVIAEAEAITVTELIQISVLLHKTNWQRPLKALPPELLVHPAFHRLWENETLAVEQLDMMADEIIQTRQLLSFI